MAEKQTAPVTSVEYKLMFPVAFEQEGRTIESLKMRELSVAELIELEKSGIEHTPLEQDAHFYARMCSVPVDVITALKYRDWKRLTQKYWATLGNVGQDQQSLES